MLLRRVIGDALRARRQGQQRTLREISTAANVSLGYLSEIERGRKEASSELLAAICGALGYRLSEVLREASDHLARVEHADLLSGSPVPETPAALADEALAPVGGDSLAPAGADGPAQPVTDGQVATLRDGEVAVSVHHEGPLRTTLHAVRLRRPDVTRAS